jgi:hypothetical protein
MKYIINLLSLGIFGHSLLLCQITPSEIAHALNQNTSTIQKIFNELDALKNRHEGAWSSYYFILPKIINTQRLLIGCEVGVSFGGHSEAILKNTRVTKLYSVDPYLEYGDLTTSATVGNDHQSQANLFQLRWDVLYLRVKDRLSVFKERSVLIRDTSLNAARTFEDNYLDFVFIDANHSYEYVMQDLQTWYPKIKSHGFLVGDDYDWQEVKNAVDEFIKKNQLILIIHPNKRTWQAIKP